MTSALLGRSSGMSASLNVVSLYRLKCNNLILSLALTQQELVSEIHQDRANELFGQDKDHTVNMKKVSDNSCTPTEGYTGC